jgi:hypothetical protein
MSEVTLLGEVQKLEIADFVKGGKIKEIKETSDALDKLTVTLLAISAKMQRQVSLVHNSLFMLDDALNRNNIEDVEARIEETKEFLEALSVKEYTSPIKALAELF